jgi:hypothetical protein
LFCIVVGSLGGAIPIIGLNLLPHFLTRHEPVHCGLHVMGFPLTFRTFGGYAGSVYFEPAKLIADLLFGLLVTIAVAFGTAQIKRSARLTKRLRLTASRVLRSPSCVSSIIVSAAHRRSRRR